jgi:hypothetical protein
MQLDRYEDISSPMNYYVFHSDRDILCSRPEATDELVSNKISRGQIGRDNQN